MPVPPRSLAFLETALLRRSVGAASAARERCLHCHRTPLVGEQVHFYPVGDASRLVCDLCRPQHEEAPQRSELMHSPEHNRAVRVLGTAA